MTNERKDKIAEAIWKAVSTTKTQLRKSDWKFSREDASDISSRLYELCSATDFGQGENAYMEYLAAFEAVADCLWSTAVSNKMDEAKAFLKDQEFEKDEDGFAVEQVRAIEAHVIEHGLRGGLSSEAKKNADKLGRIQHVTSLCP